MPSIVRASDRRLISSPEPRSACLWPEGAPRPAKTPGDDEVFVFQYWPETIQDSYTVEYATKRIPGGSHPLYQWTGGNGRDISFTAIFTAEIDPASPGAERVPLLPSHRYTVDVAAALNRLRSYMRGVYASSSLDESTQPPQRLYLSLENLRLTGHNESILCILKSAPITIQACFPSGHPRVAEVQLTFSEVVQRTAFFGDRSQIQFIGRSSFQRDGKKYRFRGTVDKV